MAWYNSSWAKRKAITLTGGSSGAQTDYQVKLTVTWDSDMQADFDDLRFTKVDGTTLLNAWLDYKTNSVSAVVWVETDTPANTVEADIYMYYGNSGASSSWSCSDTFIMGDDFTDGNYTGWTIEQSETGDTVSAATYELVMDKAGTTGSFQLSSPATANITAEKRWVCKRKMTNYNSVHHINGDEGTPASGAIYLRNDSGSVYFYAGGYTTLATGLTINDYYYYVIIPDVSTDTFDIHIYNSTWTEVTYASGGVNIGCGFRQNTTYMNEFRMCITDANEYHYIDNVFVAEYAANPATYAFGSEETNWYNASWLKRKPITLTGGASGAQTDYQVKLTVTWDSDMKSDFSDLRFTKTDGTTLLDAWMESHTASTSAIVWVETNTPANTVEADIYMYYGNSGASSDWSIANTFVFGDDFVRPNSSTVGNSWVESHDASFAIESNMLKVTWVSGSSWAALTKGISIGDYVYHARVKPEQNDGHQYFLVDDVTNSNHIGAYFHNNGNIYAYSAAVHSLGAYAASTWYDMDITYYPSSDLFDAVVPGVGSRLSETPHTGGTVNRMRLITADRADTTYYDYVFARKYAANPATYGFGSEEDKPSDTSVSISVIMRYYRNMRNN